MRCVCAIAVFLALTACAVQPVPTLLTQCTEPRPQVCTMEYAPACATLAAGGQKEYASACNACADDVVAGYLTGPCPQ